MKPGDSAMDFEIQANAFRLMRSGHYKTAKSIKQAVREDFPEAEESQIDRCLSDLARRLLENRA